MAERVAQALRRTAQQVVRRAKRDGLTMLGDNQFWAGESEALRRAIAGGLEEAAWLGLEFGEATLRWDARKQLGSTDPALLYQWVLEWVGTYSYDLIKDLDRNTQQSLARVLGGWIADGGSLGDLERKLSPVFGPYRSWLIASTEVTRAFSEGFQRWGGQSGLDVIPASEAPPKHPRCRCSLSLRRRADGKWVYIWMTARDERVCELCGPLHNQELV